MELAAHIEAMPAVRAERLLDAAQAAVYPLHVEKAPRQAQEWWRRLVSDAQDVVDAAVQTVTRRGPRFTFNGAVMSIGNLRVKLAEKLGGGLVA